MKFHYWKQFVGILFLSLLIWGLLTLAPVDPLTLARSQNREIISYLTQSSTLLDRAMAPGLAADLKLLKEGKDHVGAALTVATDQARALGALVEQNRGLDPKDMLALFVAILGGVSTIILSWRKDLREARHELEKEKAEGPRIVLR
jgi:hypothetical protein